MIITQVIIMFFNFLVIVFSNVLIPGMSQQDFEEAILTFDFLFNMSEQWLGLLLPWNIVRILLPIVIAIILMKELYDFTMWVIRKIPILGIGR